MLVAFAVWHRFRRYTTEDTFFLYLKLSRYIRFLPDEVKCRNQIKNSCDSYSEAKPDICFFRESPSQFFCFKNLFTLSLFRSLFYVLILYLYNIWRHKVIFKNRSSRFVQCVVVRTVVLKETNLTRPIFQTSRQAHFTLVVWGSITDWIFRGGRFSRG